MSDWPDVHWLQRRRRVDESNSGELCADSASADEPVELPQLALALFDGAAQAG